MAKASKQAQEENKNRNMLKEDISLFKTLGRTMRKFRIEGETSTEEKEKKDLNQGGEMAKAGKISFDLPDYCNINNITMQSLNLAELKEEYLKLQQQANKLSHAEWSKMEEEIEFYSIQKEFWETVRIYSLADSTTVKRFTEVIKNNNLPAMAKMTELILKEGVDKWLDNIGFQPKWKGDWLYIFNTLQNLEDLLNEELEKRQRKDLYWGRLEYLNLMRFVRPIIIDEGGLKRSCEKLYFMSEAEYIIDYISFNNLDEIYRWKI